MVNSQIQDYKAKAILSMSKGEQLILLYEEAIKNLRFACIMLKKDDMAADVGSVVYGEEAVALGLIDQVGGLSDALDCLYRQIEEQKKH